MQKDYWKVSKSNFQALGVLCVLFLIIIIPAFFSAPGAVGAMGLFNLVLFVVLTAALFVIASLFKKRSAKAIPAAYAYIGVSLISWVVNGFILTPPMSGLIMKVVQLLIALYLFDCVRKASKQGVQPQPVPQA